MVGCLTLRSSFSDSINASEFDCGSQPYFISNTCPTLVGRLR